MFVCCDDALQISDISVALFTMNTFKSLRSRFTNSVYGYNIEAVRNYIDLCYEIITTV